MFKIPRFPTLLITHLYPLNNNCAMVSVKGEQFVHRLKIKCGQTIYETKLIGCIIKRFIIKLN